MPKIVFLPHEKLCPDGMVVEAKEGETILDVALEHGINIEHACEKSCACTTCHCIIREGFDSRWNRVMNWKMTCWIKPGVWSRIRVWGVRHVWLMKICR